MEITRTPRPSIRSLVHIRNFNHKRRRNFLRQEWHRYVRLQGARWRRPRGMHSKLRLQIGNRRVVSIGYGTDARVRGLSREGRVQRYIQGVPDVANVNRGDLAIISRRIGTRLRAVIVSLLEERGAVIQ